MSFERRKVRVGRVVSDKMNKTVVVAIEWSRSHRLYKKAMKRVSRFKAHDAENNCQLGDLVRIIETRPLSKTKRWRVTEILDREEIAEIQPVDIVGEEVEVTQPSVASEEADVAIAEFEEAEPVAEVEVEEATAEAEEEPVDEAEPVTEEEQAEEGDEKETREQ